MKMKKLSLILLGALAATQAAQAAPGAFNGFYLGGKLGWMQRNDKTNFPTVDLGEGGKLVGVNRSHRMNAFSYGIYTGYGQNNNGFYWGGEFSIEHDTCNKGSKNKLPRTENGVDVSTEEPRTLDTKYERGVVFGLTPRIGAVISNENLIYVKLGMELSRDKVTSEYKKVDLDKSTKSGASKTNLVFVPGIGYERVFGNLLARIEYGYNFGSKIRTKNLIGEFDAPSSPDVKYAAHTIKCGLAYKF